MALDAKRSVYEIAVNVGGEMKQSMRTTARTTNQHLQSIEAQATRSASAISRMGNAVSGLQKMLRTGAIAGITMKVASGIKSVATSAISAAAEMETYRTTLNTVLKDEARAGEMMKWATSFAAHTPYNTSDVVEAVVKMQAYGMNAQSMLENIGNMASAANKDLTTAVEAVYKASIGEMELMRNNFAINKETIDAKAREVYGQSVINASGAITNAEMYNNAMLRLIEEKFAGGMEKQSKTLEGIKSNIEDSWQMALRRVVGMNESGEIVTGGLYDKITTYGAAFAERFAKYAESDTLEIWAQNIGNAVEWVNDKFGILATDGMPKLWEGAKNFVYGIAEAGNAIDEIVTKITGKGFVENVVNLIDFSMGAIGEQLDNLGSIVEETSKLITVGKDAESDAEKFIEKQEQSTKTREAFANFIAPKWLFGEGVNAMVQNMLAGPKTETGENALDIIQKKAGIDAVETKERITSGVKEGYIEGIKAIGGRSGMPVLSSFSGGGNSGNQTHVEVNVTVQDSQSAQEIGDTIGERVSYAIAEANRQQRRVSLTSRATAGAY